MAAACSTAASDDAAPTTTTTTATVEEPAPAVSPLVAALEDLWSRAPAGSCLVVSDSGRIVFERNPDLAVVPASAMKLLVAAAILATDDSPRVVDLVGRMLRESDNGAAETLVAELGPRPVTDVLAAQGLPIEGVVVIDGSGLDRGNRVTCRLLAAILDATPSAQLIEAALPVAGRTGTLAGRFLETPVAGHLRAKTGSIRGVASLVGFADGATGRTLTFAFVVNGGTAEDGFRLQDELGHHLVLQQP